jgi:hypothetical protein
LAGRPPLASASALASVSASAVWMVPGQGVSTVRAPKPVAGREWVTPVPQVARPQVVSAVRVRTPVPQRAAAVRPVPAAGPVDRLPRRRS